MLLLLSFLVTITPAHAADTLECAAVSTVTAPIEVKESSAVVAGKGEALEVEASLAPGSFLVTLQDKNSPARSAFVGHPSASRSATFSQGKHRLDCRRTGPVLAKAPKRKANYLLCYVDEVNYMKGQASEPIRQLPKGAPMIRSPLPRRLEAGNQKFSYRLDLDDMNSESGFRLSLSDRVSGLETSFQGPASTFASTVILALTIGDRGGDGRFARLGCQFTDTLENVKGVKAELPDRAL